jgi:hypothetical protein
MVNIVLDELTNTCNIGYSSAGEFKPIKINNIKDAAELIRAIIKVYNLSGEAICLETKDINDNYTELERW